jgi:hypothetical protein
MKTTKQPSLEDNCHRIVVCGPINKCESGTCFVHRIVIWHGLSCVVPLYLAQHYVAHPLHVEPIANLSPVVAGYAHQHQVQPAVREGPLYSRPQSRLRAHHGHSAAPPKDRQAERGRHANVVP